MAGRGVGLRKKRGEWGQKGPLHGRATTQCVIPRQGRGEYAADRGSEIEWSVGKAETTSSSEVGPRRMRVEKEVSARGPIKNSSTWPGQKKGGEKEQKAYQRFRAIRKLNRDISKSLVRGRRKMWKKVISKGLVFRCPSPGTT